MPSWLTKPSTDCTRCNSGSSAERDCGYRAMISFVRARVISSNTGETGDGSSVTASHTTSSGATSGRFASGMPPGRVIDPRPP